MKTILKTCAIVISFYITSCSNDERSSNTENIPNSAKALENSIVQMEDSIAKLDPSITNPAAYNLTQIELINRLECYIKSFPKDPYSAECMFKLHMLYSGLNAQAKSVAYGDSLLRNFPNYANRCLLLESMVSAYDMFITPRDTASVRKYCVQLLKDETYPETKKREVKERLKFLYLTWMDYSKKKQAK